MQRGGEIRAPRAAGQHRANAVAGALLLIAAVRAGGCVDRADLATGEPPSNAVWPTISGAAVAGQALSTVTGTWRGTTPINYTFAWQRCDALSGTCHGIGGTTDASYALGSDDVGSIIRVVVTAANAWGSSTAMSGPTPVVASFANLAFVTSTTVVPGALGGLAGGDAVCSQASVAAGLSGHYLAWLSTSATNARDRLAGARGWLRPDGRVLADRIEDVINGRLLHPLRIDELGEDVGTTGPFVATGTNGDGSTTDDCTDWTSTSATLRYGAAWAVGTFFTNAYYTDCSQPMRLYCFGTDVSTSIAPPASSGRIAFLSTQPFHPGGGPAAADALCAQEASIAGLAGTFLALLATSAGSAASRFDLGGPPWVRIDGVALAPSALALAAGQLSAALNVTALGTYRDAGVWTGAGDPLSASIGDCNDWTASTNALAGLIGWSWSTAGDFFNGANTGSCDGDAALYCLEQ